MEAPISATATPSDSTDADPEGFRLRWIDKQQYRFLRKAFPQEPNTLTGEAYRNASKLRILLGDRLMERLRGKTVVDFGCGEGREAVEMAKEGAGQVIGIDLRQSCVDAGTKLAAEEGVSDRCSFTTTTPTTKADVVVSLDAFEHFEDPVRILNAMYELLKPGGIVAASFGPTWYHPLGGHLLSVFPWAHLVLTENALLRWRADIRDDGATRFGEVSGGLAQLSIGGFFNHVSKTRFEVAERELVPIRKLRWAHNRLTREFTTALVRCVLRKPTD